MRALILDSEAINLLSRRQATPATRRVAAFLRAAERSDARVCVPASVLAEQYRGGGHNQRVDACLGRHSGIDVADTDRSLAKRIGGLLAAAGLGSEQHVDATVVAAALSLGGGVILTGDPDDIHRIASSQAGISIHIEAV